MPLPTIWYRPQCSARDSRTSSPKAWQAESLQFPRMLEMRAKSSGTPELSLVPVLLQTWLMPCSTLGTNQRIGNNIGQSCAAIESSATFRLSGRWQDLTPFISSSTGLSDAIFDHYAHI